MVICPKCHEVIDGLREIRSGSFVSRISLDDKNEPFTEEEGFESDDNVLMYNCYECDYELFNSEEDAVKFLKSKDEIADLVATTIKEKDDK